MAATKYITGVKLMVDIDLFNLNYGRDLPADKYADKARRLASDVMSQIDRHVDGHDGIEIEIETETRCGFCGLASPRPRYPEPDETGPPLCCQKAQQEFDEQRELAEVASRFHGGGAERPS